MTDRIIPRIEANAIEVGSGNDCVGIWGDDCSVVLTPDHARQLAVVLIEQALNADRARVAAEELE